MAESDGIVQVGEVPVVIRRVSVVSEDFTQAQVSARDEALREVDLWVSERIERAPRFTDTRPLTELRTFLADKIREAASGAST